MQTPHISIIIEYYVAAENRELFLARLSENCAATLKDDGCLRMEIAMPDGGDGSVVFLTERWRDQAAIEKHRQQSGHDRLHERIDTIVASKRVTEGSIVFG